MNRGTLIMLILVLGLGGFYYFYEYSGGKTREHNEKQEKRLFPDATAENMTSLEVTAPDAKTPALVLEKKDGRWVHKGPPDQLVSVMEVGGMANRLVDLQRSEMILEKPKPEELGQFGLDKPAHQLVAKAGGKTYTLLIGAKTPDGESYYVRSAPDGPVVTVPGTFTSILEKSPEALRALRVLPGDMGKMVKVRLIKGGQEGEVTLNVTNREESKDENEEFHFLEGDWSVVKPFQAPADGSKVDRYLNEWNQLRAGRFLKPDEKADFSKPELRLEVWEDKQTNPQILEVGPPVAVQPTMRYVRRLNPEEVAVVDFSKSELLGRTTEFFRDRHLFAIKDVNEVEKLEGKLGDKEFQASRSGDEWTLAKPSPGDKTSQNSALSNFLWEVSEAQSTENAPAGAKAGLEAPRARLTLFKAKGEKVATVLVGAPTPDGKGCYLQLEGKPEVLIASQDYARRWEELLKPLWPGASPSPSASPSP